MGVKEFSRREKQGLLQAFNSAGEELLINSAGEAFNSAGEESHSPWLGIWSKGGKRTLRDSRTQRTHGRQLSKMWGKPDPYPWQRSLEAVKKLTSSLAPGVGEMQKALNIVGLSWLMLFFNVTSSLQHCLWNGRLWCWLPFVLLNGT